MVINMREHLKMVSLMVMALILGKVVVNMRDLGKKD
jgi:hypothetical protein